ncbi:MAG TPA: sugar kinase [Aliidongia sp.]|nr:sugar kinase [Aliidongia sp.]
MGANLNQPGLGLKARRERIGNAVPQVVAIGECMIELSDRGQGTLGLGYAGDTLNTALYLKRTAGARLAVDYLTALGDDPYSDSMLAFWQAEGIGTDSVARLPGKLPGLYMIRTDPAGERRFHYWRSAAAAKLMFEAAETMALGECIAAADLALFSGITLSILSDAGRDRFFEVLAAARAAGTVIAYDGNYRPAGWPDAEAARTCFRRFLKLVDVALPSIDDEANLFGPGDARAVAARLHDLGVAEVVVKQGEAGSLLSIDGAEETVPVENLVKPLDTTAAGDSFNAGYLAGRLTGLAPAEAARFGGRVAAAVIQHRGAIIPLDATPRLPE